MKLTGVLEGKVIVVSGGTKGVGRGLVEECAKQGATVVIGGRDEEAANRALAIMNEYGKEFGVTSSFVYTDLKQVSACENLIKEAVKRYGRIDGFVNYAGLLPSDELCVCREEQFDEVFTVNVKAAIFCAKAAVTQFLAQGGGGSLVFVGSAHAYGGEKDRTIYACSKGALLTLMKHISKNYAPDQIRSNWITMGWVATEGELALRKFENRPEGWLEAAAAKSVPMGRLMTVEDHVPGIIYLLSDMSKAVTGTELNITGGFSA